MPPASIADFGPVKTILVLLKNLLGGIDMSPRVVAVFQGKPFSASKIDFKTELRAKL